MLYLKYDNSAMRDGIGAQALRIVILKAVSDFFRCGYLNSPMTHINETFADGYKNSAEIDLRLRQVNDFFRYGLTEESQTFSTHKKIHLLTNKELLKLLLSNSIRGSDALAEVCLPFPILDRFPFVMNQTPRKFRMMHPDFFSEREALDVVVHLRMGYGEAVKQNAKGRYLPFDYYVDILNRLLKNEKITKSSRVVVHTDLPSTDTEWQILTPNIQEELKTLGIKLKDNIFRVPGIDLSEVFSHRIKRDLEFRYCDDFFSTLLDMSQAKLLVMGRSAFSYLAGLMNPNQVIWPNNHGHPKMTWWKSSIETGVDATKYRLIEG